MAGVTALDHAPAPDLEIGQAGAFASGREGVVRHHRTAHRQGARVGPNEFGNGDAARAFARSNNRTEETRARRASGAAARGNKRGFTEDRNVDENSTRFAPDWAYREPVRRTPSGDQACRAVAGEGAGLGEAENHWCGQNQRAASIVSPLRGEDARIERVMENESTAVQQPGQQRQADAGEGSWGKGRKDVRMLRQATFKQQ